MGFLSARINFQLVVKAALKDCNENEKTPAHKRIWKADMQKQTKFKAYIISVGFWGGVSGVFLSVCLVLGVFLTYRRAD